MSTKTILDPKSEYGINKEVLQQMIMNTEENFPDGNELFSRILTCSEAMGMFPRVVISPQIFKEVLAAVDAKNGVRSLVPKLKGQIELAQPVGMENKVLKLPEEGALPIVMIFQPRVGTPDQAPSVEPGTEGKKNWGSFRILPDMKIEDSAFQQGARLLLNQQGWIWNEQRGVWDENPRFNTLFVSGIPRGGFSGREKAFNSYDTVQNHQSVLIAIQDVLKVAGLLPINPSRGERPGSPPNIQIVRSGNTPAQEPSKILSADEKLQLLNVSP
jgi:hypothetical protein